MNKERYKEFLVRILNDHYNDIKKKSGTKERQQYLDGYLLAARVLDAFSYDELKEIIGDTHFKIFGKTIPERKQSDVKNHFKTIIPLASRHISTEPSKHLCVIQKKQIVIDLRRQMVVLTDKIL